jgi:hypothetical protein
VSDLKDAMDYQLVANAEHTFGHQFVDFAKTLHNVFDEADKTVNRQFCTKLSGNWTAACLVCVGPSELVAKDMDFATTADQRDELRDLCVLLFDAVKYGNQVVDLPGIWNKAKEVLKRTDQEDKP